MVAQASMLIPAKRAGGMHNEREFCTCIECGPIVSYTRGAEVSGIGNQTQRQEGHRRDAGVNSCTLVGHV